MIKEIEKLARVNDWVKLETVKDPYLISFLKGLNGSRARVNIYLSNKAMMTGRFTVGTSLAHPKRGKTQLFRRGCDIEMIAKIFMNPRIHTKRGYYEK